MKIATFDLSASASDISVNSIVLKKDGLGSATVFKDLVLLNKDGRISSKGNFDSTTDTVELSLTNTLVIKAGSTETISVVGTVGATTGDKVGVSVVKVNSSALTVKTLPVSGAVITV